MQIKTDYIDIPVAGKQMRTFLAHPAQAGQYPGIIYFSDIFQVSEAMQRACARLAGYGFVVAAHEIFHRLEPADRLTELLSHQSAGSKPVAGLEALKNGQWFAAIQQATAALGG